MVLPTLTSTAARPLSSAISISILRGDPSAGDWTNYKESLGIYQGALDFKDSYAKAFYETTQEDVESGVYDASKLRSVIAALLEECTGLAAAMLYSKS